MTEPVADRLLDYLQSRREELLDYLGDLVRAESPTHDPESIGPVFDLLEEGLRGAGLEVRRFPGRRTGGHLLARPGERRGAPGVQLLLGHADTVWPRGTLAEMPLRREDGKLLGPGVFDMKGGLAQMVFALQALRDLELDPPLAPVALINSDEEVGSPESGAHVRRLARVSERSYVLEPGLGPEGKLKTARKGNGRFVVIIRGEAAHAGLNPESGASAIEELSHVIQSLHALNDPERGITVNVGVVEGGQRPNVTAPECRAEADVRVVRKEDAEQLTRAILSLEATTPGTELSVEGEMLRPPMERTEGNVRLWKAARRAARQIGLEVEEGRSGGASDGNFASQHTPTLDGLGPVGGGAHADHEFVFVDSLVERSALLALLLMEPASAGSA